MPVSDDSDDDLYSRDDEDDDDDKSYLDDESWDGSLEFSEADEDDEREWEWWNLSEEEVQNGAVDLNSPIVEGGTKRQELSYSPSSVRDLLDRYRGGSRSFDYVDLPHSNLRARNLAGSSMIAATLDKADLKNAVLSDVDLSDSELSGARLDGADLENAILTRARLNMTRAVGANFRGASLQRCHLTDANLRAAVLHGADLSNADLNGADCRDVNFTRAVFGNTNLRGANLDGANLSGASFSPQDDLLSAKWNTLLIDGVRFTREQVESGRQVLPIGGTSRLRFLFEAQERLTGDELAAARDLSVAFGSVAKGARIALEVSAAGERLVVESAGDYERAAEAGLAILQGTARAQKDLPLLVQQGVEVQAQLDQLTLLVARTALDAHRESAALRGVLARLLSKLPPTEIQFPTAQATEDFEKLAEKLGYRPDELTFNAKVARFTKRYRPAAEATVVLLAGLLGEAVDIPGGFDAGAATAAVGLTMRNARGSREDGSGGDSS